MPRSVLRRRLRGLSQRLGTRRLQSLSRCSRGFAITVWYSALPAVGFACGMERLVLALAETDIMDRLKERERKRVFVVIPTPEHLKAANWQCQHIRDAGHIAETDSLDRSMKAQMKAANRSGADYVLIPESADYQGNISCRNMETSEQVTMTFDDFLKKLKSE